MIVNILDYGAIMDEMQVSTVAIALYEDRTMKYIENGTTQNGTYQISDEDNKILTLSYGKGKEGYQYLYKRITSEDGRVFERMGTYKVTFVTESKTEIATQILSPENGYVAKKPEEPKKQGVTFTGWVTRDGSEFDFEKIVTSSVTLYAKWTDGEGREIISGVNAEEEQKVSNHTSYIVIPTCIIILSASAIGCIAFIKRGGKKHAEEK